MDYTVRYGLEFSPFLKNSKEIFVSTDESKEVLFRLNYLAKTKGFGLLTGSPGRGKTTAIRAWRQGRSYILEKLQGAGAARAIFEDAALEAVLNAFDGTPRVINNLCNSCLLIGDSGKSNMITAEIVMQAINNNEI